MFFTRHFLAPRITRKIGLSPRSRETAAIMRVIVSSANQTEAEAKAMTVVAPGLGKYRRPKKWLAVLRTAAVLDRRPWPIEWLSQELAIPRSEAIRMLQLVSQAAQELLGEYQGQPVSVARQPQHPTRALATASLTTVTQRSYATTRLSPTDCKLELRGGHSVLPT